MEHALELQRQMQWYKFVEKLFPPIYMEQRNNDGLTPWMLFKRENQDLKLIGETWMRKVATLDTKVVLLNLVATLLFATVLLAAAIIVAPGNKQHSFESAYIICAVSDLTCLITSMISLFMFLDIQLSGFAEEDFLYALPNRLIIGLLTLFVSIVFLMAAFGAGLYVLFDQKIVFLLLLVVALGHEFTVVYFALLQFPVLKNFIYNTYFSGEGWKQH